MNAFEKASEQIEAQIGASVSTRAGLQKAIEAAKDLQLVQDRTFIAKWIVCLYVGSIAVSLLYLIYRGIHGNEDTFVSISEIIKVAVVPIVTLVIGFYFGTTRR